MSVELISNLKDGYMKCVETTEEIAQKNAEYVFANLKVSSPSSGIHKSIILNPPYGIRISLPNAPKTYYKKLILSLISNYNPKSILILIPKKYQLETHLKHAGKKNMVIKS